MYKPRYYMLMLDYWEIFFLDNKGNNTCYQGPLSIIGTRYQNPWFTKFVKFSKFVLQLPEYVRNG